jgi:hypothetical protein
MIHPTIVGSGKRLFNGLATAPRHLVGSSVMGTGVAVLDYATNASA